MTDKTIREIQYGNTGSGDFVKVTQSSKENGAILVGNQRIHGKTRFVIYKEDVDMLILSLQELKALI